MRYLIYCLSFLFLSTAFISCKGDDDNTTPDLKAENRKQLGVSAADMLSSDTYKSMTLEFVFTASSRPSPETVSGITNFLAQRVNKPDGITVVETLIESPSGAPYTIDEIRDIEDENRTQYTVDDNIAVYLFFANGNSSNDTNTTVTLGTAYQNTSMVVYQQTLVQLIQNNPEINLSTVEQVVTEHEFGHLFGLVNIQDDDIHNKGHEDPENNRHCVVEECIMYFQSVNTRSAVNTMFSRSNLVGIPTFDDLCIADLQAKGGK